MRQRAGIIVVLVGILLTAGMGPAVADGHDGPHGSVIGDDVVVGDSQGGGSSTPGGGSSGGSGSGSSAPVYTGPTFEDYWTPSCSANGPPGQDAGALCMGAVSICDAQGQPDAIYMQHWRRQVTPTEGPWSLVGNECRGADEPTQQQPQVTADMVVDAARAAAPQPEAFVQPGTRSYVNVPNNYFARTQGTTVPVTVLGQAITVTFAVQDVAWDFGDGTSGQGAGTEDAAVGAPGAVEHDYATQGDYAITVATTYGLSFTLPNGQAETIPGAITMTSDPYVLPVGEIQTRVDATG